MTPTGQYIRNLQNLKPGDLSLLRLYIGKGLEEAVAAFDLFTGLWWPLRQKSPRAPRRSVAWLIAKLYAFCPLEHTPGNIFPVQLAACLPNEQRERDRFQARFNEVLLASLDEIEPNLQWALEVIADNGLTLDWVKLTDDLSVWEREAVRLRWAENFIYAKEGSRC